eukprot:1262954-Alexandrium_andersonii.AAC.1
MLLAQLACQSHRRVLAHSLHAFPPRAYSGFSHGRSRAQQMSVHFMQCAGAVSYTHLTLPTICSV